LEEILSIRLHLVKSNLGLNGLIPPIAERIVIANRQNLKRSGTAAVECGATLMFVLAPLMIGTWEVGRLVFCQQVVVNACREGARLAAQGRTINTSGAPTDITISSGSPCVKDTVFFGLVTGGLPELERSYCLSKTTFTFISPYVKANSSDPDPTEPSNAQKGQPFRIALSIEWSKVRWISLGIVNPTTIDYQVDWRILVDDPFSVSTTMPAWNIN
jgi:hypothetical protein